MDGTTSSSLNEVRLGREKFGGDTHAYCVAFSDGEIDEVAALCDTIIFNSLSQLERFAGRAEGRKIGLRINPQVSSSRFELADPARAHSRLGEWDIDRIRSALPAISGIMIHCHCDNDSFPSFCAILDSIDERFGPVLTHLAWVSLGGGIHFTGENYPLEEFADRLKAFASRWGVQVYLEPGEAVVTNSTTLEVTVLDIVENGKHLAIVDASTEAHMLDLLTYRLSARLHPDEGPHRYVVCGQSCLAGDEFGEFRFEAPLQVGDRLSIQDAGGYSMVKKNWFNGLKMPSIAVRDLHGKVGLIRSFSYADYCNSLS
ncbi:carboxynorspermidine decarboxylase [uncultured Devosia sp.]|uniref:carboxynorspermidine decarboxylase n=1 Tax=uncultured Devosia sp. TaxID=211434 RepID=UPI0035CC5A2C